MGGDLNLTIINGGTLSLYGTKISGNTAKNIFINIAATDISYVSRGLIVYGKDVTDSVQIRTRGDATHMTVYCPVSNNTHCSVDCTDNMGTNGCQSATIYTRFGIGNDLQLR